MKTVFLLAIIGYLFFYTSPAYASGLGTPNPQCPGAGAGTLSPTDSISCSVCVGPLTCATTGQLIVIFSRDDDNSVAITHTASDNVAGTTGWNQAGCAIGNQREALCMFWKIATTSTPLIFTVSFTPTGNVQNAELNVYAFPNTPAASPLDCFASATFASNAATHLSGTCTTLFTTDSMFSTAACASATSNDLSASVAAPYSLLFTSPTSPKTTWTAIGQFPVTAGAQTATWNSLQTCTSLGSVPGTIAIAGFKAADGAPVTGGVRHSVILGFNPNANDFHMKRIPWGSRRRKLQIVSI